MAITWWAQLRAGLPPSARQALLLAAVTLWGLRLTLHLGRRRWGQPEDKRYRRWRVQAGPSWWWRSYFKVFLLQGVLMWIISAPLVAVTFEPGPALGRLDAAAAVLCLLGFAFEAVADWQLAQFEADPENKGRLLTEGLWRFSRHPNYFGETLQWWGFYLLTGAAGARYTVFSPLLMTFLILRVSGVPLLERDLELKPGFEDYARRTSAFIPWCPKPPGE